MNFIAFLLFFIFAHNSFSESLFHKVNINKNPINYKLSKNDEKIYISIKKNISKNNWFEAYKLEKKITNLGFRKAINTYISLNKFKDMESFTEIDAKGLIEFNTENYFLSEFDIFNKKIESIYLENILKFPDVKEYFSKFKTKNIDVLVKYYNDYLKQDNIIDIKQEIKIDFIQREMDFEDQEFFRKSFPNIINESDLIRRTEFLVFKKKFNYISKNIDLIKSSNYKKMFENILKINKNPNSISEIIKSTPRELKNNSSFLITRVRYYRLKNDDKSILDILFNLNNVREYEEYWWLYKHIYIRELLKVKKYEDAYKLASSYNGSKNIDYVEAQWLAGWISLRYLHNYNIAYEHFLNINKVVSYPLSVSKATYWLGRSAFMRGDEEDALKWYSISSRYSTTFYGQLSHYAKYGILIDRGEKYKDLVLPTVPPIGEEDIKNIDENGVVKLAFLYYSYEGRRDESNKIFKELISNLLKKDSEIAELIEAIMLLNDDKMTISLSKLASYKSVFFVDNLFPVLKIVKKTEPNIALIHAIIKQESGFIVHAESVVGAIGFMQIMPNTAKVLCQQMKITYNKYKLRHDPQYNISIGSFYIKQLIKQFGGSKILAIASYNAGPAATKRWINSFWDPRKSSNMDDVIDWMESITYKETRNYVQRILENLIVYEYKLGIN